MAGFRPRLATPMMLAILGRLKDRELSNLLSKLGFRSAEIEQIEEIPGEGHWRRKRSSPEKRPKLQSKPTSASKSFLSKSSLISGRIQ